MPDTAPAGELSPAGAETGDPQQDHEASVSRNAVEAEINSLNQIAAAPTVRDNWLGEMIDACDADDAWGRGQGSIPANSPPAGVPVHEGTAMPHVPVNWDAEDGPPQAYTTTTFSSLVAQHEDSSEGESLSI